MKSINKIVDDHKIIFFSENLEKYNLILGILLAFQMDKKVKINKFEKNLIEFTTFYRLTWKKIRKFLRLNNYRNICEFSGKINFTKIAPRVLKSGKSFGRKPIYPWTTCKIGDKFIVPKSFYIYRANKRYANKFSCKSIYTKNSMLLGYEALRIS